MTTDELIIRELISLRREALARRAQEMTSCPDCGRPNGPDHRFACEIDRHVEDEIQ